ncbi:MAG: peptide chain release factor 2 [Chloroflexota bacterium]
MYEELRLALAAVHATLQELRDSLEPDKLQARIAQLEEKMTAPDFWGDQESAQKVVQELSYQKERLQGLLALEQQYSDLEVLLDLAVEAGDDATMAEVDRDLTSLAAAAERLKISTLLSGRYDALNATLTLHAGAGGTEAQDWVSMLARMYQRWGEKNAYKVEVLDRLDGEEAGLKSIVLRFEGRNAYGFLRGESGVHRLVRISPFDASGRRHTSFASADVVPEIEEDDELEIKPEEIEVDTYRSSGAGGQHINKTDSAVRIKHLPTGIVVACQSERSQMSNRATAMRMLRSKLIQLREAERERELAGLRGEQHEIAFGSQIRSYVFQPYTLVKDHRTSAETGSIQAVMDGELDQFIYAYLQKLAKERGIQGRT